MTTQNMAKVKVVFSMSGSPSISKTYTIAGQFTPTVETDIAAAATDTMTGIAFAKEKLAALFLLCDLSDCVVTFTNTDGPTTISLKAGVPYLWVSQAGSTNPLENAVVTMTVQNNGAQNVSTPFHARFVLMA
jgi:hypothetical protein